MSSSPRPGGGLTRRACLSLCLAPAALLLVAAAPPLTGRQIMDEVSRRQTRPREFAREKMTLIAGGEVEAVRIVRRYLRRTEAGTYRYLIVYDSPAGIAGTAALTWQVRNGPDDQWLYLPGIDRLTRIIGGAKRKSFMGTDFAFEDLSVEDQEEHAYSRLPDTVIDGRAHFVVRAVPVGADVKATTGYSLRQIYVRQDVFLITRVDYFGDDPASPLKSLTVAQARQVGGETWRATDYAMTNPGEEHATHVETLDISFADDAAPAEMFEQRYLTSHAHRR